MNHGIFKRVQILPDTVIGRIWVGAANKSADQYNNGHYRNLVAERLLQKYVDSGQKVRNNLRLQKSIAALQMGARSSGLSWCGLPVSADLLCKWFIYAYLFPLYKWLQPYRQ